MIEYKSLAELGDTSESPFERLTRLAKQSTPESGTTTSEPHHAPSSKGVPRAKDISRDEEQVARESKNKLSE